MIEAALDTKKKIEQSIENFSDSNLLDAASALLNSLGYRSDKTLRLSPNNFVGFSQVFDISKSNFDEEKACVKDWNKVDIIFQLGDDDLSSQSALFDTKRVDNRIIESFLFLAIELNNDSYNRSALAKITREVNKLTSMPAIILFKYNNLLTISIIDRRLHKRDASKDVLEKVTLIKDIDIEKPHRAHLEILFDLSFDELSRDHDVTNFVGLHRAWQKTLDTKELNKKFFRELANWYFWATQNVTFPDDEIKDKEIRNATNVIRLITRVMFVWFLKEKGLISEDLFNEKKLKQLLKFLDKKNSTYYKAILQNLFFATLNTEMGKRRFRLKNETGRDNHYFIHNVFRYENEFINPKDTLKKYFDPIPFLNGGLFECLDKELEGGGKIKFIRIDGFSDREDNKLKVPDLLFFSEQEKAIDLNKIYGTKNKRYKVRGLIDLLNSYKFTITENTPIEEEIALDPELLGKVFENLLANYNPETQTTARKQTGSFYTPREIVNYMVDESLIAYLVNCLGNSQSDTLQNSEDYKIRSLISYSEIIPLLNENEKETLISAIDSIKILDPACGSGAFPMGILHKLVHVLHKIDPQNEKWKQKQIEKVDKLIEEAEQITDNRTREKIITDLEETRRDVEEAFENNELDYGRKLYLIENCIYGVDIQPIAVQIAKLRFFISLIVDQKVDAGKENLGVRPLPNLETKFVAANTLLALEKENDNLFTNPQIEKKKEDLKKVRHDYFEARTPKRKETCRKRDKQLREELTELLIDEHNLQPATAKKLANWDPYDQNDSAQFFEPEWMFGFKNGFHIVIGNPPYFNVKPNSGLKNIPDYKLLSDGIVNSASLFIKYGFDNSNLIVSFIVPKSLSFVDSWKPIRAFILNRTNLLVSFDVGMAFENVGLEMIVIIFNKNSNSQSRTKVLNNLELNYEIEQKYFRDNDIILTSLDDKKIRVIEKIAYESDLLRDVAEMPRGLTLNKKDFHNKAGSRKIQILGGTNIQRYQIKDGGKRKPNRYINIDNTSYLKKIDLFQKSRIVYQNIASSLPKVVAAIDPMGLPTDDTINNLIIYDSSFSRNYILGFLNSSLVTYYLKNAIINNAILTVHLDKPYVGKLPIKSIPISIQQTFDFFVESMLFITSIDNYGNYFEQIIDAILYEIYFTDEIKSAGCEILKHLTNLPELKEDWLDDKKVKTIEKVYKDLSNPKHPVRSALLKMQNVEEVAIIESNK